MVLEIPFELISLLFLPVCVAFISLVYYKKSSKYLVNYFGTKQNNNLLIFLGIYFVLIIIIECFHLFESLYIFLNIKNFQLTIDRDSLFIVSTLRDDINRAGF